MENNSFLRALNSGLLLFDGGFGTLISKHLPPGSPPYSLNLTAPETVLSAHKLYAAAGADVITSNTFTASGTAEVVAGVKLAAQAGGRFTALGVGPIGSLIEPLGDMTFESAYLHYAAIVKAGTDAGADLILIETMSDLYECKAAVLAAKENTSLPVVCTVTVSENGRLLTGCDIQTAAAVLQSLGVDALGINCSLGPAQLLPFFTELLASTALPAVIQPNAGMPRVLPNGETVYDVSPASFAEYAQGFARSGASMVGGCCGTTPEHIALTRKLIDGISPIKPAPRRDPPDIIAASGTRSLLKSTEPPAAGERLNAAVNSGIHTALRSLDMDTVMDEALEHQAEGCLLLRLNADLPDIDVPSVLVRMIRAVQSVSNLPLQISSADPSALKAALRAVNGKPIITDLSTAPASPLPHPSPPTA